jgi:hypothetical protein
LVSGDGATVSEDGDMDSGLLSVLLKFLSSFFRFNMVAVLASSYLVASIESSFSDKNASCSLEFSVTPSFIYSVCAMFSN